MKVTHGRRPRLASRWRCTVVAVALAVTTTTAIALTLPTAAWAATAAASAQGASVHCTSDLPEFGPLSVTQVMAVGSTGFLQLGDPTPTTRNKFIGTCTLTGVIPAGWTVNEAAGAALSATPGSGNAGTFVWDSSEDDADISDAGTFVNSGTFTDNAVGFVQNLSMEEFVNTGTVVSNAPGFGAQGTTGNPTCPTCTFINRGALRVGAKAAFISSSIFQLPSSGTILVANGGKFDVANESTFYVEGGSAKGTVVTGQFLGQGPATVEFAPDLPATSEGKVDVATNADLKGVIPRNWEIDNTGGSIAATGSGNYGTFVMEPGLDDSTFSDGTPFVNSGTFIDNASGFAQSIQMPRFVDDGNVVVDAPDFSVAAPSGVTPVFIANGSLTVGPKGGFSAGGVFDLKGTIVDHGGFSIDGTTLDVEGGTVKGHAVTALYHLGATPGTIEFDGPEAGSSGAVDIGIAMTLDGVIPAHWTLTGGSGAALTAEGSGNDGTIDWTGNGHFVDSSTFVNRGTVSVQGDTGMYASVPNFVDAPQSHTIVSGGADLSLTGNLSNSGNVDLTSSVIALSGNYAQEASGVLGLELASSDSSGELKVTGDTRLAGALAVTKAPSYSPRVGDSQQVLTAHLTAGRFGSVTGTTYAGGLVSKLSYSSAQGVSLVVRKGS